VKGGMNVELACLTYVRGLLCIAVCIDSLVSHKDSWLRYGVLPEMF
jgi:hypothetical protein